MKPSPLQLLDYFIADLHVSANPRFNPKQEVPLNFDDFHVTVDTTACPEQKHQWTVILNLRHQPPAKVNAPYRFRAQIVGEILVLDGYPEDRIERLVKTNAASMLYGILREVVRDNTSRGPYAAVILPTISFYESQKENESALGSPEGSSKPTSEPPKPPLPAGS